MAQTSIMEKVYNDLLAVDEYKKVELTFNPHEERIECKAWVSRRTFAEVDIYAIEGSLWVTTILAYRDGDLVGENLDGDKEYPLDDFDPLEVATVAVDTLLEDIAEFGDDIKEEEED